MANLFLTTNRGLPYLFSIRRLSSFNNNRTKSGIISIITNEELNVWSENNWSEFAKQFNKPIDFPLPGQVGVTCEPKFLKKQQQQQQSAKKSTYLNENLHFLFKKPLAHESQIMALKEAAGGVFYEEKMEKNKNDQVKQLFELKSYECPLSLKKDFQNYFQLQAIDGLSLSVITVSFKTENDMATWNGHVDNEREILMKKFVETATELCGQFEKEGFWADFIDPSSGRPYKAPYSHATFYETDERYRKLGFEIIDYGCCKVVSHHEWGTKTYVGCVITNALHDGKFIKQIMSEFRL